MFSSSLSKFLLAAFSLGSLAWVARWIHVRNEAVKMARWQGDFFLRREWLEANFLKTAGSRGTPRGLAWADCDFDNEVAFARDRRSGEPTALVAVSIRFEAIAGGGMEEVEAVANRKAATAVFRFRDGQWTTDGRAVFNLNPLETINHYQAELERVEWNDARGGASQRSAARS